MSSLPSELLLYIVDCLIPSDPPIAFPPNHEITRVLLSLSHVSKVIQPSASRHLISHCLYIDSPDRLKLLLRAICNSNPSPEFALIAQSRPSASTRSLYLAPFLNDSIDDRFIVLSICRLFAHISPSLTRLVIDMPLRSLYPEDDRRGVRKLLRSAFQKLTALEEFVSTRDELYLGTHRRWAANAEVEPEIWSLWPKLRRLALYNVDVSNLDFLHDIQECTELTHLVMTRSDGLEEPIESLLSTPHLRISDFLRRVTIVNTWGAYTRAHTRVQSELTNFFNCFLGKIWACYKSQSDMLIFKIEVPSPKSPESDEDITLAQEWVRDTAIQGKLWEWPSISLCVGGERGPDGQSQFIYWDSDLTEE